MTGVDVEDTATGRRYRVRTDTVVSAAGVRNTYALIGQSHELADLPEERSAIMLFLGLDQSPATFGLLGENHWFMPDLEEHDSKPRPPGDGTLYVSFASLNNPAALPADLGWAAGQAHVAAAMAGAAATMDGAGEQAVPATVRKRVRECLAAGAGAGYGLGEGLGWLESEVSGLPAEDRPAGRLAMLIAFASYRVPDAAVHEFRAPGRTDADLLALASWTSFAAARQVGSALASRQPGTLL